MKKIIFLCICLSILNPKTFANNKSKTVPSLVVIITIDNFNLEYINKFSSLLDKNGIKKIENSGAVFKNVKIDYAYPSSYSGMASIVSGTNPSVHGVVADDYVERGSYTEKCFCKENVTNDKSDLYSNSKLQVTNLADELYLNYKQSKVYSVSFDPCNASFFIGHSSGTACWFDEETGDWISNNNSEIVNNIVCDKSVLNEPWKPLYPSKIYTESDPDDVNFVADIIATKVKLIKATHQNYIKKYTSIKITPFADTYTTDFVINLLKSDKMGDDRHPDILHINYKSLDYIAKNFGVLSAKYQDAFYRLDKNIARLISFVESEIGLDKTLFVLTSPKPAFYSRSDMNKINLKKGNVALKGGIKLLNLFLNKKFNERMLIEACNGQEIFLNNSLIKLKKLNRKKIVKEVISLLEEMSGVKRAYSTQKLMRGEYHNDFSKRLEKNYNNKFSGDISVETQAGWTLMTINHKKFNLSIGSNYNVPLVFYGWKIIPKDYYNQSSICDIAATISNILKITPPPSSVGTILNIEIK